MKKNSFEEIEKMQREESRNVVIFIHTDWCQYCKAMENTTFKNKEIINVLNDNFYFVELNAEDKNPIEFDGKKFRYKPTGNSTGIHEVINYLDVKNFPTIVILNPNNEIIFKYEGFLITNQLLILLDHKL